MSRRGFTLVHMGDNGGFVYDELYRAYSCDRSRALRIQGLDMTISTMDECVHDSSYTLFMS